MSNYEMDAIDTASAAKIIKDNPNIDLDAKAGEDKFSAWNASRDRSVYETDNVQNPDLKKYIESMREYIARDDYMKHVDKSANAARRENNFGKASGYWNDELNIPSINKEAETFKKQAQEALSKIDVNTLSTNDFMKLGDVQCNANNIADNLKSKAVDTATLRATIGNLSDDQTATIMNRLSAKAQRNFMHNAEVLYPEAIPSKEDMQRNAEEAITKLLDEKPRPDFTKPANIKDCMAALSNDIHRAHVGTEAMSRDRDMNKETPTSKPQYNTSRYDVNALAYGTLNNEKTGLDFN